MILILFLMILIFFFYKCQDQLNIYCHFMNESLHKKTLKSNRFKMNIQLPGWQCGGQPQWYKPGHSGGWWEILNDGICLAVFPWITGQVRICSSFNPYRFFCVCISVIVTRVYPVIIQVPFVFCCNFKA